MFRLLNKLIANAQLAIFYNISSRISFSVEFKVSGWLTKVQIQHGSVGSFNQDRLPILELLMKERDGLDDHGSDSNRELSVAIQLGLLVDHQALEANGEAVGQIAEP